MPETLNRNQLYETEKATIVQCDETETFWLYFSDYELNLRFCELQSFRKKVLSINLAELLDTDTPDIEVIYLGGRDRFVILGVYEVLELRELFAGAFTMMELNSLLHKSLYRQLY